MTITLATGLVHHLTLTVTNVQRSVEFYTSFLGFQLVMAFGPRCLLSNGSVILALTPPSDPIPALPDDRFSENRVGLDHVSLNVARRADLETARQIFASQGVVHGEIKDLGADLK